MSKLEITSDRLATVVAEKVVSTLAVALKAYAATGAFPTAEDVERIRDHVSPNGVAYQNGKKDERKQLAAWLKLQPDRIMNVDLAAMVEAGDHWK